MQTPNFAAVIRDYRAAIAEERIEAFLATEAQVLANALHCEDMLNRRHARALPRRFTNEPITGFSHFHDEEPPMTPDEKAADDRQDYLRQQAKDES